MKIEMLEKIGLPAKPAIRGNNWVVDASHCQGCSSQFTFINRKHHCRRCGGLFCNGCTLQRMYLRGQGDSPVRICEPCKKLEEAARFEMRHGYKSRLAKGSSKLTVKDEDDVLNQILGADGKETFSSGLPSTNDMGSSMQRATSDASCSNSQDGPGYMHRSNSVDEQSTLQNDVGSTIPEELRQKAIEEKGKYKILKGEGKPEEALRAYKRGKELERQAEALEISMRKNRKKVLSSGVRAETHNKDSFKESGRKNKLLPKTGAEKDDFAAELRELGWNDMDIQSEDKKPASMSLEGELSSLLGDISQKTIKDTGVHGIDKSPVVAFKRKALMLKREGKLAEAKEELRRAKILEKQIEEQQLLAEAEDSDDELSAIIRTVKDDEQDDFLIQHGHEPDFDHLLINVDDLGVDSNFEVTDEDMEDPEIAAALKAFGWTDDSDDADNTVPHSASLDREALSMEILSLKREALNQKREGNVAEAMAQLKKAKLLERDLESINTGPISLSAEKLSKKAKVDIANNDFTKDMDSKAAPKNRLMIQKELLGLKKKALSLRREGRIDEAEEELKKGKFLEHQLEEMDNALKMKATSNKEPDLTYEDSVMSGDLPVEEGEDDVTDHDMHDPSYLSILRNLGWNDEDNELASHLSKPSNPKDNLSAKIMERPLTQVTSNFPARASSRSKAELQRELLGLKRKALSLRREGKTDEAEVVLETAKALEAEIADMEMPKNFQVQSDWQKDKIMESSLTQVSSDIQARASSSKAEIQRELLGLKRKGLSLRREGKTDEAEEILKTAKELEAKMADMEIPKKFPVESDWPKDRVTERPLESTIEEGNEGNVTEKDMHDPALHSVLKNVGWKVDELESVTMQGLPSKEVSGNPLNSSGSSAVQLSVGIAVSMPRNKGDIQRQLLKLKRKALALRRKGETEEAEELLKMAKVLEAQMEELDAPKEPSLEALKTEKSGSFESLINHDKQRNLVSEVGVNMGSAAVAVVSNDKAIESSQLLEGDHPLLGEFAPPGETGFSGYNGAADGTAFVAPSSQPLNLMDLLTGNYCTSSQIPAGKLEDEGNIGPDISSLGRYSVQMDLLSNFTEDLGSKSDVQTDKREVVHAHENPSAHEANSVQGFASQSNPTSLRHEVLAHKRKAVALKREGKLAEAREELRRAKLLEKSLEEDNVQPKASPPDVPVTASKLLSVRQKEHDASNLPPKPLSARDRFKLQQESLSHKRKALKLRREGRMDEAEAEFEIAKNLEAQLEELTAHDSNSSGNEAEPVDDIDVEDLLDPQLLSALKAIGIDDANVATQRPKSQESMKRSAGKSENFGQERTQLEERPEPLKHTGGKTENVHQDRSQLEERIKAEKVKALNLKRSGKQAEALDALRRAKLYEKKLNSLASN